MLAANSDMSGGAALPGYMPTQPGPDGQGGAAAPSTMTPGPIPGVDTYATAALQAKTAYQKALAQINGNRQTALHQFGYRADIDPNSGVLSNMSVDPNNPYGAYQSMLNTHATEQQQVAASNAARGLGHGGLAAQGITADHKAFGADSAQLGQSLMQQLEGFQGQQGDAENSMNDALYQAQLIAAQQAIANQAFDTPDFSGVTVPAYGAPAAPAAAAPAVRPQTKTPAAAAPKPKILPNAYTSGRKKRG